MNIRDGYNSKKVVTFDTQYRLDDKRNKLSSMMRKLTAQGNIQNKQFKPKIYQGKRRGHTRSYNDQGDYHNWYISNSWDIRTSFRGRGQYGQNYRKATNMLTLMEVT